MSATAGEILDFLHLKACQRLHDINEMRKGGYIPSKSHDTDFHLRMRYVEVAHWCFWALGLKHKGSGKLFQVDTIFTEINDWCESNPWKDEWSTLPSGAI